VSSDSRSLTKVRKAAVVLLAMGEEATAEVFKHLNEAEIEMLACEMATLGNVPARDTERVMEEFHTAAVAANFVVRGDEDFTRRVLSRTHGPEAARKISERVQRSFQSTLGFSSLERADPQQLSKFILGEHPQTIALILAHMHASRSAQVIAHFPDDLRIDVLTRMANLDEVSPDIVTRISGLIEQRLKTLGGPLREQRGGIRAVAELFNHMERTVSTSALDAIESQTPDLAASIRNLMVVFDDLAQVDDSGIRELIQRADKKSLTVALKGTSEDVRQRFFGNMSKRAAEMMREEMEVMGAVRVREVEKAQQEIVALARTLEAEGVIVMGGSGDEAYVN
jgi:flagellar motor switch protein FliG